MNKQSISIDDTKFSKASKKLLSQINEIVPENNKLKLTQIQEILSKSLGYRNFHDLNKFLSETKNDEILINKTTLENINNESGESFLKSLSSAQILKIISSLISSTNTENLFWINRALNLMETVLLVLNYLRDQKEIEMSIEIIKEYLNIDILLKLHKRKDFPKEITTKIKNYLFILPGFEENVFKQQVSVLENHGYLNMQFIPILNKLELVENNNLIIADKSWFIMNSTNSYLSLKPSLLSIENIEDSWIYLEQYQEWIMDLNKKNKLNNVRVSDLLLYITTIMSIVKKDMMILMVRTLLDNYSIVSEINQEIKLRLSR